MNDSWDELKKEFQKSFSGLIVQEPRENEIRAYIGDNRHVFYVLLNEREYCQLEFRIEYGNHHQSLIDSVASRFPLREYDYRTHYTDSIWRQRQKTLIVDELKNDLTRLREIVEMGIKNPILNQPGNTWPVKICSCVTAKDLLCWQITIPAYQRAYCWQEKNVRDFFVDIETWQKSEAKEGIPYHLGTIILREREPNTFDIIDGQQRLTTMAILAQIQGDATEFTSGIPLLNTSRKKWFSEEEIQNILRAKNYAKNYIASSNTRIDFSRIEMSVVILSKTQPEDLAYTFFSNSNSTGKRLSDYDLLKTHHLRYITSGPAAEKFSIRWHDLEKSGHQDDVLQKMLFRLRKWVNNENFPVEACDRDERDIFNHFRSVDPLRNFPSITQTEFRFNSLLEGGKDFFIYTEYYRKKYEDFAKHETLRITERYLSWHSNGVIFAGIKAIAYLFFCKFGDMYLKEAIYLLAYHLSELRNRYSVRTQYLSDDPIFKETARFLDQVTSESQFFAILSDVKKRYSEINHGPTADKYWNSLHTLMKAFEYNLALKPIKYINGGSDR